MRIAVRAALAAVAILGLAGAASAQELRITWYNDGNEGEVLRSLLDRFEKENAGIKVVVDTVPFKAILENLPTQLKAGQGPDLARVNDLGGNSAFHLDITPYVKDPKYWEANFGAVLPWVRPAGQTTGIYGMQNQLTVTGPFINATLFQQANVPVPGDKATWDEWAAAVKKVATATKAPMPLAMDRSGHRVAGPAIAMGAKFLKGGEPALVDDGLKAFTKRLVDWHKDGTMPKTIWGSVGGTAYKGANEEFANGQVVMYFSGSWQIGQFTKTIGDAFDWRAVPSPCGPASCTGMPGGTALIPIKATKHPKEVGRLMDFLASEAVLGEYAARTLMLQAHKGLVAKGIDFKTDNKHAKQALAAFSGAVGNLAPEAFALQGYTHNRPMFNAVISRVNQAIAGEMSLEDAWARMDQDVKEAMAAVKKN